MTLGTYLAYVSYVIREQRWKSKDDESHGGNMKRQETQTFMTEKDACELGHLFDRYGAEELIKTIGLFLEDMISDIPEEENNHGLIQVLRTETARVKVLADTLTITDRLLNQK